MSIIYCPRCDDDFDGDAHTEPLCPRCMRKVTTVVVKIGDRTHWQAVFEDRGQEIGTGSTEDMAIRNLIEAL